MVIFRLRTSSRQGRLIDIFREESLYNVKTKHLNHSNDIICKLEKIYLEALGGTELFDDFTFVKDAKRPIADRNLAV